MEKEDKLYELCEHEWETIEKRKVFVGTTKASIFNEGCNHYDITYIQECKKCGKLNKI